MVLFDDRKNSAQYNSLIFVYEGKDYSVPGFATVSFTLSRDLKKEKIVDGDGENVKDNGGKNASVNIELTLSAVENEEFIASIFPILKREGKEKGPIGIKNANLNSYGLSEFILESVSFPSPKAGSTTISFTFSEYKSEVKKQKAVFGKATSKGNYLKRAIDGGISKYNDFTAKYGNKRQTDNPDANRYEYKAEKPTTKFYAALTESSTDVSQYTNQLLGKF